MVAQRTKTSPPELAGRDGLTSQRTHVSELGFPCSARQWAEDKVTRDGNLTGCPSNLWLIHGKLYDLNAWMRQHPGGVDFLTFTRGTDATVAFETHHLNVDRVEQILAKFFVRDADEKKARAAAAYTWDREKGMYEGLRRDVFALLQTHGGTGPSRAMQAMCGAAIVMWCLAFAATCWSGATAVACVAGYFVYVMMGVGHNFFHQADSLWRFAFDLSAFSSQEWRISHAISHHMYPNLDMDIEASGLEPFLSHMRNSPSNHWSSWIYWHLVNFILPLQQLLDAWIRTGKATNGKHMQPENMFQVLQLVLLCYFQGLFGLWLFAVMHGVSSYILVIFSTPVHRSTYGWTEGCPAPLTDFAGHTLQATNDYCLEATGDDSLRSLAIRLFVFGSFNDHVAHHLFPTVDLSKQHLLRPLIMEAVDRFDVPYQERSYLTLAAGTARALNRGTKGNGNLAFVRGDRSQNASNKQQ